jgi:hypothetical protein
MNENSIRDLLAKDLSIIEPGLQLLEIEKFIPSELGTKSFLDILAKDGFDHWVIIEVKKTNAAAREAAHEVFKYVEAVQRHFGARNDEIRAIVVSVEWGEMLVPFSRLRLETTIAIDGVRLELDESIEKLQIFPVDFVPMSNGRYLAPWHELNLYHDRLNLESGIKSYDKSCKAKGIKDYIMVVLKAAEDFHERATLTIEASLKALGYHNKFDCEQFEYERFEYILYFSPQILTKQFCLGVIKSDPERFAEVIEVTAKMDEKAELCTLHENVYYVEPIPFRDYFEIGYAAKFGQKLLVDEGWIVERVLRRGKFERNTLLADRAIIEELKGSTGSSGQLFSRSINLANRAHISSAREGISVALSTNPAWLAQLNRVIDEISLAVPNGQANIQISNPSSGVFTLYFLAIEKDKLSCMPRYEVVVENTEGFICQVYFGLLVPSGEPIPFNEILQKYYGGRLGCLMSLARNAGFYEIRDSDILDDLGLTYRSFRVDNPNANPCWFELRDDRWRSFEPNLPLQPLQLYFDKQASLMSEIVSAIGSRMHSGFHDES